MAFKQEYSNTDEIIGISNLQAIIDNMCIGVAVADAQGSILTLNKAALEIYGFQNEEEMFSNFSSYVEEFELQYPDGSIMPFQEWPFSRAKRGDYVRNYEVKLIKKAVCSVRYIVYNTAPVYDNEGKLKNVVFNMVDQTESKIINDELKKSEQRYNRLFNNKTNAIAHCRAITDPSGEIIDYYILQVNDAYVEITGLTHEMVEGKSIRETFPGIEETSINHIKAYGNIAQHGGELTFETYFEPFNKWFSVYAYSSLKGEFTVIFNDITERKKGEEQLKSKEAELIEVHRIARIGSWSLNINPDADLDPNRPMCIYAFDFNSKSLSSNIDQSIIFYTSNSWKLLNNSVQNALKSEEGFEIDLEALQNNQSIWLTMRGEAAKDKSGKIKGLKGTIQDITERKKTEQILAKERELFLGIFDNIPVMITIYDIHLKHFKFNREFKKIAQWTEEDTLDGNILSKVYPDPTVRDEVIKYMNSLEPGWKEFEITAKDGQKIASSWANISLPSGIMIGIGIDIRAMKRAEEKIREEEERFRTLADNIAPFTWMADEKGNPIWFSKRWYDYTGIPPDDALKSGWIRSIHPDYIETVAESFKRAIESGTQWEQVYPMLGNDGNKRWYLSRALPVKNENGKIIRWFGSNTDITEQRLIEESLRQNEQRLQVIFNNAAIGIVEVDVENRFVAVNNRVCEILGYSADELIGKRVFDITYYEDLPKTNELYSRLDNDLNVFSYEKRYVKKDGSIIWVQVSVSAIRDEAGNRIKSIGTIEDISERKETENALKQSEETFATMFESSPIGISLSSFPEGRYYNVNKAWLDITEYNSKEEIMGKTSRDLHLMANMDERERNMEEVRHGGSIRNTENVIITKRGNHKVVSTNLDSVQILGKKYFLSSFVDITERIKYEQELRFSEEQFRSLFENITEGVALHELIKENGKVVDYKIINVNPAFTEHTGIPQHEAIGQLASVLYNSKEPPFLKEFSNVALTRKAFHFDTFYEPMNKHFVINVIAPRLGQFATVFEDITEQKRKEREIQQKNEELTRFIYTVSHDLKSPLVTIKSFTSYLKEDIDGNDKKAQEKDIAYIQNAADKMGKLLDELLELSRVGRKEEARTEVLLNVIIQSAIDLVAGRISEKKAHVFISCPSIKVYGFTQRLIQLFQNLIDNAVKFSGQQENPEIEIGAFKDKSRNNEWVIFVRDNGIGIDPRYHHKIFGLFEKLDNSKEGTGIGLALIKRIVEVHEGSIWFASEGIGKGTTFYFTLKGIRE